MYIYILIVCLLLFIDFNCSYSIGGTVVEAQGDEMTRYEHAFVLRSYVLDMYERALFEYMRKYQISHLLSKLKR